MPYNRGAARKEPQMSEWERGALDAGYAESGNVAYAARRANVSYRTASTYCNDNWQRLQEMRAQVKQDIRRDFGLIRQLVLEELITPARLKKASTTQLLQMAETLTDKIELLAGNPTHRVAVDFTARAQLLAPEDRERAREIQRKLQSGELTSGKPVEPETTFIEAVGHVA